MQNVSDRLSILIVEDNPMDMILLEEMLQSSGVKIKKIFTANRSEIACEIINNNTINLVLLDLSLPDSFGIESFLKIKSITQKIPVIILTGLTDSEVALDALNKGAQDYLVKGEIKPDALVKSIHYSIERKNAEEKILASEEKYRQMFYKNPFPAWIYDLETLKMLEVNDAAIQQYGYDRDEFLNLTIKDIRPSEDIHEVLQSLSQQGVPDQLSGKVWRHKKKSGDVMLVEITFYKIDFLGKIAMQAQVNDVTEKYRLEKELAEGQKLKQQQITEAVLSAQEKERKCLGEELHDNINQILATSRLFLSTAIQENNFEFIVKGQEYISMAMEEIRKLSKKLITPAFIRSGLNNSIDDLIENTMAAKKITIKSEIDLPDETDLDEGLKLTIYRIMQEQLNNIIKHAEASAVSILIRKKEDVVILSIVDNGKGFDMNQERNGIGITNINSRAGLYNGKVEIDSSPGNGCRLNVTLQNRVISSIKAA